MLEAVERVRGVTAEDIMRVADTYLVDRNRTIGLLSRPVEEALSPTALPFGTLVVLNPAELRAAEVDLEETVKDERSGGSVFVTSSVPANSVVTFKPPELRLKKLDGRESAKPKSEAQIEELPDYVI